MTTLLINFGYSGVQWNLTIKTNHAMSKCDLISEINLIVKAPFGTDAIGLNSEVILR